MIESLIPIIPHLKALGPYFGVAVLLGFIQIAFIAKIENKAWRIRLQIAAIILQIVAAGAMLGIGIIADVT